VFALPSSTVLKLAQAGLVFFRNSVQDPTKEQNSLAKLWEEKFRQFLSSYFQKY
jgi:hypothetical protein